MNIQIETAVQIGIMLASKHGITEPTKVRLVPREGCPDLIQLKLHNAPPSGIVSQNGHQLHTDENVANREDVVMERLVIDAKGSEIKIGYAVETKLILLAVL